MLNPLFLNSVREVSQKRGFLGHRLRSSKRGSFKRMADYYATALHEHPHWSGAEHRLDRPLVNRLGTEEYAQEELIVRRVGAMKGVKIR